jgi:hypothetical protein
MVKIAALTPAGNKVKINAMIAFAASELYNLIPILKVVVS